MALRRHTQTSRAISARLRSVATASGTASSQTVRLQRAAEAEDVGEVEKPEPELPITARSRPADSSGQPPFVRSGSDVPPSTAADWGKKRSQMARTTRERASGPPPPPGTSAPDRASHGFLPNRSSSSEE